MKQSHASLSAVPTVYVVYNLDHESADDAEPPLLSDASVTEVANIVADVLRQAGRHVELVEVRDSTAPLAAVAAGGRSAIFFNLVESIGRDATREREVPALLRKLRVPFTGNEGWTLDLAVDKGRVRRALEEAGVPVARGGVVRNGAEAVAFASRRRMRYPLFVKPARLDASIAVTQASVVRDAVQLHCQVEALRERCDDRIVVEEYLPGLELAVAVLPTAQGSAVAVNGIDFSPCPGHLMPIVTYDSKWVAESEEFASRSVPAEQLADARTTQAASEAARRALRAVGATGYARVDLRLDAGGQPRVIDINPNPDLHPDAGFARSLGARGYDYPAIIEEITIAATRRQKHDSAPVSASRPRTAPRATAKDTGVLVERGRRRPRARRRGARPA